MILKRLNPVDIAQISWEDAIEGAFMMSETYSLNGDQDFIIHTLTSTIQRTYGFGPPGVETHTYGEIKRYEYQFMGKDEYGNIFSLLVELTNRNRLNTLVITVWSRERDSLKDLFDDVSSRVAAIFMVNAKEEEQMDLRIVDDGNEIKIYPADPEGKISDDKEMMDLLTPNKDGRRFIEEKKKLSDLQKRWIEGMLSGNLQGVEFDLKDDQKIKKKSEGDEELDE